MSLGVGRVQGCVYRDVRRGVESRGGGEGLENWNLTRSSGNRGKRKDVCGKETVEIVSDRV